MDVAELAKTLERLGCPAGQSALMAAQLDKRAKMDSERKGIAYDIALRHLTALMAQGWAAQRRTSI